MTTRNRDEIRLEVLEIAKSFKYEVDECFTLTDAENALEAMGINTTIVEYCFLDEAFNKVREAFKEEV